VYEIERIISLSDPYSSGSAPTCFANGDPRSASSPSAFDCRPSTVKEQPMG